MDVLPLRPSFLAELSQPPSPLWITHTTQVMATIFRPVDAGPRYNSLTSSSSATALPPLIPFVKYLVSECHITNATLLHAIVYTRRLHARLPQGALAQPGSAHRIFVAALLLANKYVEDTSSLTPQKLSNTLMHWSALQSSWSRIALTGPSARPSMWWAFPEEIARIERAFLKLMDFQLYVSDKDMTDFIPIIEQSTPPSDL
ncbi:hypothetical protein H4R33_004791 [Dimargaris cristalligena]|nr:hypothetical protein H4R33_004791 [Dimargaris cristalligena]